jgi:hypothetical protein
VLRDPLRVPVSGSVTSRSAPPHVYLHADLALKQRTLDRIAPPNGHPGRYRAPDAMLAFLDNL